MSKIYTVRSTNYRNGSFHDISGTIEDLMKNSFSYTLKCGAAYERERGNSKINRNPKSIKTLISNLNKAIANSAANGSPSKFYSEV